MGTVTIGTDTYDIYGTEAGALTYFRASFSENYTAQSSTNRKKLLVTATRLLDAQVWQGERTDTTTPQPLAWPRKGVTCDGVAQDENTVPTLIEEACYELASAIAETDSTVLTSFDAGSNVKRKRTKDKVDVLESEEETEYFVGTGGGTGRTAARFPAAVHEKVKKLLASGASLSFGSAFGTTVESAFGSDDIDWGFTGGGLP